MIKKGIFLSLLLFVLASTCSFAGELKLTNGKTIIGKIIDADTYVVTVRKQIPIFFFILNQDDQIPRSAIWEVKGKNPGVAFLWALGPGFFARGVGHAYAEDDFAAQLLAGSEVGSVFLMLYGAFSGNYGSFIVGEIVFFGSWVFDFVHAPASAENYNKRILRDFGLPLQSKLQVDPSGVKVCLYSVAF